MLNLKDGSHTLILNDSKKDILFDNGHIPIILTPSFKPLMGKLDLEKPDNDFPQPIDLPSSARLTKRNFFRAAIADCLNRPWSLEALWIFTSTFCLGTIIVTLLIHDGRPRDSWTFFFSLNTVVSTLSTIAKSTLTAAVSSSLAQGKWIWFKKRRSELTDFDLIDSASRGPWGSLWLLWRADFR